MRKQLESDIKAKQQEEAARIESEFSKSGEKGKKTVLPSLTEEKEIVFPTAPTAQPIGKKTSWREQTSASKGGNEQQGSTVMR